MFCFNISISSSNQENETPQGTEDEIIEIEDDDFVMPVPKKITSQKHKPEAILTPTINTTPGNQVSDSDSEDFNQFILNV